MEVTRAPFGIEGPLRRWGATLVLVATLMGSGVASASTHRFWGPVLGLSKSERAITSCILWTESRSTFQRLNLADVSAIGSTGPWQMEPILWNRWSWVAGIGAKTKFWYLGTSENRAVTIPAYKATPYQQELVFVEIVHVDGFSPWRDGCW